MKGNMMIIMLVMIMMNDMINDYGEKSNSVCAREKAVHVYLGVACAWPRLVPTTV